MVRGSEDFVKKKEMITTIFRRIIKYLKILNGFQIKI